MLLGFVTNQRRRINQISPFYMTKTLSTSEFAKALGISESSVRRMTDSGDLQIHRTRGGHRRIPVPEAIRYVRETKAPVMQPEMFGLVIDPSEVTVDSAEEKMLGVLKNGHAAAVTSLMQSLYASGIGIAEICDGPIAFAMREIGDAWPHDKKAIFIEHRAVILCCRALNQLRLSVPEPEADAPQAIGGAMTGDVYLMPTLMASLVLHELGYNETNLGPNLPLDVLTDCVIDESPELVWLSISEPIRSRTQGLEVAKLAEAAEALGSRLIVGGRYSADLDPTGGTYPTTIRWCATMRDLEAIAKEAMTRRNRR